MMGSIAKARIRPDLAGSLSGARCIPQRYAGPRVATSIDLTPATQHTTVAARAGCESFRRHCGTTKYRSHR